MVITHPLFFEGLTDGCKKGLSLPIGFHTVLYLLPLSTLAKITLLHFLKIPGNFSRSRKFPKRKIPGNNPSLITTSYLQQQSWLQVPPPQAFSTLIKLWQELKAELSGIRRSVTPAMVLFVARF